jgi:membrane protein
MLRALAERSAKNFIRHDMAVYSMALAYCGLFALLPFAVFLAAVLSFFRVGALLVWQAEHGPTGLRGRFPELIESFEDGILGQTQGGLLLAGIALAFWSVTIGARIFTKALNAVYEVRETRPAWKRLPASVALAPALALVGTVAVGLMLVTSTTIGWASSWLGLNEVFVFLWSLLRIPIALLLLSLVVSAAYRFAPNRRSTLRSLMPGALLAVALWALASLGFAFLAPLFPDYGAVYGSLGASISLLLYLYASALAVLLGAEVNAAKAPYPSQNGTTPKTPRKR